MKFCIVNVSKMMNPENDETATSGEFKPEQDEEVGKQSKDVVLVANVIEASKDGEVVKYTIQTKEVRCYIRSRLTERVNN